MQTPVQKPVGNLAPGAEVLCPRCGAKGKVGVDRFKAGGKEYLYWTVRHYEGSRVRRCVLGPASSVGTNAKVPEKRVESKVEAVAESKVPESKVEVKVSGVAGEVSPVQLDRAAWYVTKLLLAYGTYRARQDEESFRQLLNVLHQVRERLNVDVSAAEAAIAALHAKRSTDAVIAATTAVKELAKSIIARILAPGTQAPAQTQAQVPIPEAGDLAQVVRDVVREEVARLAETVRVPQVPEVKVEVPREVVDAINAVRDQVAAIRREVEYVKEQVRQRKGWGARAVSRGEKKVEFREGNLYWMIAQIMKDGKERTKEQLAEEIRERYGKKVSGNSLSGRLSELAAAGYVTFRREGRAWLWRWTGT